VIRRAYLGDAVYVAYEAGDQLVLTTENGVSVTNRIVLEPEVWEALKQFVRQTPVQQDEEEQDYEN
jgi:hypothetical protein